MFTGVAQNRFIFCRIGQRSGFCTQLLGEAQGTEDCAPLILRQGVQVRRLNVNRVPGATKLSRQAGGSTYQLLIAAVMPNAQQNGVASMPDAILSLAVAPGTHLIVHPVGGASQRQLAQGNQVPFTKEMFDGPFGLPGDIDFAFVQTLAQIVRGQVDQHHFIGRIEKRIGDGFAHLNACDAADHVVQAFQMLHVNGGKDVDTRFQQLFNILPALRVA